MQVVEKVSQKGCTTYQSIADELITGLQLHRRQHGEAPATPVPKRRKTSADVEDDGEKNVRRRVYDSLNVLKAVGAVVPLRNLTGSACKEVVWAGLPPSPQELQAATDMQDELKAQARDVQQTQEQLQVCGWHIVSCRDTCSMRGRFSGYAVPFCCIWMSGAIGVQSNLLHPKYTFS